MTAPISTRALAERIPDTPQWIDLRGLLLSERCDVWAERDIELGFVAGSWDFPFASVHGRPRPELILAATAAGLAAYRDRRTTEEWELLATPEHRPLVAAALPGWRRQGIVLHRWESSPEPPARGLAAEIRLLQSGHRGAGLALDRVPAPSLRELALDWVSERPMAVAVVDSRPVTFCYAAFTTESLWDVSIETLEPFRRRGLAAACFLALAAHMKRQGKAPAWGAMEDNPASLGLAARLGFVPDSALDGWSPEE